MDKDFSFEEIVKQNQNRIYYHIHKLHIRDPHNEFYVEGLYALWKAYKKYEPQKGPMATYFNYTIRNHLIDQIRKEEREKRLKERLLEAAAIKEDTGNRNAGEDRRILDVWQEEVGEEEIVELIEKLRTILTEKQMKWLIGSQVHGYSLKEIAQQEGVTEQAVKSWGREARRKIRKWRESG